MATDGAGIDPAVRERAVERIDAFKEVLDEAADELMRAVAAVMLELGKQPSS